MTTYRLVMPEDMNHYGFLFGGKMLMWVDEVARICCILLAVSGIVGLAILESDGADHLKQPWSSRFKRLYKRWNLLDELADFAKKPSSSDDVERIWGIMLPK